MDPSYGLLWLDMFASNIYSLGSSNYSIPFYNHFSKVAMNSAN